MKFSFPKISLVFLAAFFLRLALVSFGTLDLDFNTFVAWSVNLAENGPQGFYEGWSDYLPGYLYVLWFLGKIRGILPDVILYKLPAILADVATGYLIYRIVGGLRNKKWGLISSAIYLFNPAVWANSTLWGQADSLTALFSLIAVFSFDKNFYLSATALAVGTVIKPQAAFALPVILLLFLKKKVKFIGLLNYWFIGLLVFILAFVPFWNGGNFISFVVERLATSFNQYPYTSVNAFNFWGIFGFWAKDSLVTQLVGLLVTFSILLAAGIRLLKKENSRYVFLAVSFTTTFLFLTRMHERHLLPLFAPLTAAAAFEPVLFLPLAGFSATYLLNLYYSFNWITYDFKAVFPPAATAIFSFLNLALLAFVIVYLFRPNIFKNFWVKAVGYFSKRQKKKEDFPKPKLSTKHARLILAVILLFSLVTRVVKLSAPAEMYFDEVYHAFTAKLVLHADPKAWEWWNPHPEGFAYEWTHPPLAKLAMAAGMKIFGENSFGWRFPGVILGIGILYLAYRLGKELFRDEMVGILSAAVLALDGLALGMSRIGMNDTYFLFFALLAIYLFFKEKNFFAAASFGLALTSKWSAIWVLPILFIIWLNQKKKFKVGLLWFLVLPPLIYLSTYFQMFLTGHDIGTFWGMQKQMWWYHTGLKATHAYGSSWASWPLLIRPVYLYTSEEVGGWVSRIYAMGNPAVFWFGLASVVLSSIYALKERRKNLALVVFAYLIFFVPWAVSPRIMFLYHYLPSVPFLAIATGYTLRRFPKLTTYYLLLTTLLFVYFYPHWAGLKVPLWLDTSYYWLPSWR